MNERMFSFLSHNHKKSGDTCNPLAGECLHKCRYCYVETLKKMFPGVAAKYSGKARIDPKELANIAKFTEDDVVFICDCADLFGYWVPTEIIATIFEAIKKSPAIFLLLTKYPRRYRELIATGTHIPLNCIVGCTVESDIDHLLCGQPRLHRLAVIKELSEMGYPTMLSVEPVMKSTDDFPFEVIDAKPKLIALGYDNYRNNLPEPRLATAEATCRIIEDAGIMVYRKTMREANPPLEPLLSEEYTH